jgi:hypothetical protein
MIPDSSGVLKCFAAGERGYTPSDKVRAKTRVQPGECGVSVTVMLHFYDRWHVFCGTRCLKRAPAGITSKANVRVFIEQM